MTSNHWEVVDGHVLPIDDLKPHEVSPRCWCGPTPDDDAPSVLVHHSMDKREEFEQGERKPT